jgi:hypothetical protein
MFNPTDVGVMHNRFKGMENAPLGQLLEMMGMDLQAPGVPQLKKLAQGQLQGIDPIRKMQNIARGQNARMPPPAGGGVGAPPPPGAPPAAAGGAPAPGGAPIGNVSDMLQRLGGPAG